MARSGFDTVFAALDGRTAGGYLIRRVPPMPDTAPELQLIMRDKIMARPGEERFVMGAQMFDSAREMVKASLPPGLEATTAIAQTTVRERT